MDGLMAQSRLELCSCRGWVSITPFFSSEHSQSGAALPVVCCVGCILPTPGTLELKAFVSRAGRIPHVL